MRQMFREGMVAMRFWRRARNNKQADESILPDIEYPEPPPADSKDPALHKLMEDSIAEDAIPDSGADDQTQLRNALSSAIISSIRSISNESDRKEVIAWFVQAREILRSADSNRQAARDLYHIIDSKRVLRLLARTSKATFDSYKGSKLPLSIKVALPVTVLGGVVLGGQGIGLAAFGGAIGLPVVVVLFLGTAGLTAIVEAFIKDKEVRDPLTRLLVAMLALEANRRATKEMLRALREEAAIPKRQDVPQDRLALAARLRTMDPTDFERHVMSLFESDGYPVGVTPRSNDFGVDGFVVHPDGLIVVQCKRNSEGNPVGRPVVQQFKGVVEEQAALRGYIVTTSTFTREAQTSAGMSDRIVLVDCELLLDWHEGGKVWNPA